MTPYPQIQLKLSVLLVTYTVCAKEGLAIFTIGSEIEAMMRKSCKKMLTISITFLAMSSEILITINFTFCYDDEAWKLFTGDSDSISKLLLLLQLPRRRLVRESFECL